jgi:hypothetical protein
VGLRDGLEEKFFGNIFSSPSTDGERNILPIMSHNGALKYQLEKFFASARNQTQSSSL